MEHRALCGWLMKQDAQRLWKGWKKRWFQQLNDYQLYYFATCTTDTSQSKGFIDLKAVVNVQVESRSENKYIFSVSTPDRNYVLQANSEDECSYWISGINSILASLSQPLTAIIPKAELYTQSELPQADPLSPSPSSQELQHQLKQEQRSTKTQDRARPMSMRVFPAPEPSGTRMTRSNSVANITYVDNYEADSPPSPTSSFLQPTPPISPIKAEQQQQPPPPQPSLSASDSGQYINIMQGTQSDEQGREKEKIEQKKWASMRDINMLIIREKDGEIDRLKTELQRFMEMHEQTVEATKHNARKQQEGFAEQQKKFAETERRFAEEQQKLTDKLREREVQLAEAKLECESARERSTLAQAELEQAKKEMQEKISILENEIQQKENVITQLNSTITSLNGELSSKDSLLYNARKGVSYPDSPFDNAYAVAQLEKERQTRQALSEQCAFLGQEVYKLETEVKHLRSVSGAQKSKILEMKGPGVNGSTSVASDGSFAMLDDDLEAKIRFLTLENDDLRQKYFLSVGRSLKLQTSITGGFSNMSITDLYDTAMRENIKIEEWPNWISNQLANSLFIPT